jgi:hypothetical protein
MDLLPRATERSDPRGPRSLRRWPVVTSAVPTRPGSQYCPDPKTQPAVRPRALCEAVPAGRLVAHWCGFDPIGARHPVEPKTHGGAMPPEPGFSSACRSGEAPDVVEPASAQTPVRPGKLSGEVPVMDAEGLLCWGRRGLMGSNLLRPRRPHPTSKSHRRPSATHPTAMGLNVATAVGLSSQMGGWHGKGRDICSPGPT